MISGGVHLNTVSECKSIARYTTPRCYQAYGALKQVATFSCQDHVVRAKYAAFKVISEPAWWVKNAIGQIESA